MKNISFMILIILILVPASVFAGYKESVEGGNAAYRDKDWVKALEYYKQAYEEKQTKQLSDMIAALERKVSGYANDAVNSKPIDWGPVSLIGVDVLLCGAAVYSVVYEAQQEKEYNDMYDKYNGTTEENRKKLLAKQKHTYMAMTYETAALSIAGAGLVFTLGDLFFTHTIFRQDSAIVPVITPVYAGIMLEGRF